MCSSDLPHGHVVQRDITTTQLGMEWPTERDGHTAHAGIEFGHIDGGHAIEIVRQMAGRRDRAIHESQDFRLDGTDEWGETLQFESIELRGHPVVVGRRRRDVGADRGSQIRQARRHLRHVAAQVDRRLAGANQASGGSPCEREVDAALSQKLSTLMFEGPEAELTLTANAQPALMAVSLAVTRVLEAHAGLNIAQQAKFIADRKSTRLNSSHT